MQHSVSDKTAAPPPEFVVVLQRIDRLAMLLDARYRIPLSKIYFGWDAAVGLVPVAGDLLMAAVSIGLIRDARRLGASRRRVWQMVGHVGVDLLVGAVPLIGPVFDVFYRANLRILKLLIEEIGRQTSPPGPAILGR